MVKALLKPIYNTILSQTISSDGNYLFCGNNFGEILVFNINLLRISSESNPEDADENILKPIYSFVASEKHQIYSMSFYKDFLIVGTDMITGYIWNAKARNVKVAWEIKLPVNSDMLNKSEINYLWLDSDNDHLYAGCGDNNVYGVRLEDGKVFKTLEGHKDYIHCIDGSENRLVSASEDGTVKMWDLRSKTPTRSIEPNKNEKLSRPEFGKWIGAASLSEDWLILGGGPRASLWHLRSLDCTIPFEFPDRVHVAGFVEDGIMFGGESNNLYQYSYNGDKTAEIPVSSSAVYSVVWQNGTNKLMSIGGASNNLDICTNFSYKDIVLSCYAKKLI